MGIGINVGSLFQGLSSSNGLGDMSFYSDYASLKNGSYSKLMKSYYGSIKESATAGSTSGTRSRSSNVLETILEEKRNPKVSKDTQKSNADLEAGLSSLKSSLSALQGGKTYTDTENGQKAADKVVSAMKSYVADYNNVVNAAKGSTLSNKTAYVSNVMTTTAANADKLAEIGITIDSSGKLELNESKLRDADVSKVQEMFSPKDIMSYGATVASRLQFASVASSTSKAADSTETTSKTVSSAASLKGNSTTLASDALYEKIKDKDGNETYDVDKIFGTAKSFVKNYNDMFDAAESSSNSGVLANLSYIREKTARGADVLKQFGISVDEKGKMKIDEDTFKKSDMSKVQDFFKDYGSSVATNASLVDYYMTTQADATSGYTADGEYNVQGSARYAGTV